MLRRVGTGLSGILLEKQAGSIAEEGHASSCKKLQVFIALCFHFLHLSSASARILAADASSPQLLSLLLEALAPTPATGPPEQTCLASPECPHHWFEVTQEKARSHDAVSQPAVEQPGNGTGKEGVEGYEAHHGRRTRVDVRDQGRVGQQYSVSRATVSGQIQCTPRRNFPPFTTSTFKDITRARGHWDRQWVRNT